jgi:GNAT superfamily N-acetyltransferase
MSAWMNNPAGSFTIEMSEAGDPRWEELLRLVDDLGQKSWFSFRAGWHQSEVVFAALVDERPVGFLRYVVQPIGVEDDLEPLVLRGRPLLEAKVLAFGVAEAHRRRGIGRALQETAIQSAAESGCYQVRSFSGGDHPENHRLKLALGFAVHPVNRNGDAHAAYFILPLQARRPG